MTTNACGVDFGTSNSTVGWHRPGQPSLLALEDGKPTLPSVVFFNADEDSVAVGRAALGEYLEGYEGRLMRSLKSILGTGLMNGQTEVQGRVLRFLDLLAMFIDGLKTRAERQAGRSFRQAVFGRPVFFVDDDPKADKLAEDTLGEIARRAGFSDIEFQFEPIAAAFDYESRVEREELVLVVDIGGGTSDFTLIRVSPERAGKLDRRDDILANCGVHIGGTDFDKQLSLHAVMPLLGLKSRLKSGAEMPSSYYFNLATWHTINFAYTRQALASLKDVYNEALESDKLDRLFALVNKRAGHWLAIQVEAAKIGLSSADLVTLPLGEIEAGLQHDITRAQFDQSIAQQIDTIESTVRRLLVDANVKAGDVDTVFFTGGASGVPLLRQRIAAVLPTARAVEGDLYGSIGCGLALDAARRFA
ncbi:Hsp70 family protein [Pseudogulbenkiania ferrooxidans]|uniref:Putative heat-shock protein HSP 70 n=1 Tax=Pseudogulbenkiania ferrooxidans 2002 TaxID=279714 RepID=B9Z4B0_9NEIS|nr:Hsp70 family protein [Pseudogulbenkiania ferrooxidans]EEG08687.1 putative heat-shock protein HSP 70 [Pseudogulbenkiania ferrooxidans 2002]